MDLENQARIKELAEQVGRAELVVILGAVDEVGADMCAQTVTTGDPSYTGPLAGVQLGLPVYHVMELKEHLDPTAYAEHVEMMEMVIEKDSICHIVRQVRGGVAN